MSPVSYTHLDVYKRQAYISQMWAEAMEIYRSGMFKLSFSPAMQRYLKEHSGILCRRTPKPG